MFGKKAVLAAAFALVGGSIWAGTDNLVYTFSTKGPDCYADGTKVADGEWYALVKSSDKSSESNKWQQSVGALKSGDVILLAAPLAKGGRCPYAMFQIDQNDPRIKDGGFYYVCLLDTRDESGVPATVDALTGALPPAVTGAPMNEITERTNGKSVSNVGETTSPKNWEIDWDKVGPAAIKAISVVDANVQLRIVNLNPNREYAMVGGETLDDAAGDDKVIGDLSDMVNQAKLEYDSFANGAALHFGKDEYGRFFRLVESPSAKAEENKAE